jgi:FkbM family methyltransferase
MDQKTDQRKTIKTLFELVLSPHSQDWKEHILNQITILRKAIKTTRNFWIILSLRVLYEKRIGHFRNGIEEELEYSEYLSVINSLDCLSKESFNIIKNRRGYFLQNENAGFTFQASSLVAAPALFELALSLYSDDWIVEQTDVMTYHFRKIDLDCFVQKLNNKLFTVKFKQFEIVGPYESLSLFFFECVNGTYGWNFDGKIVLDVGAFCGETAVFFWSQGAKKIIIYEPVLEHQELVQKNMIRNNINAEIHTEGIGEKDGIATIRYDSAGVSFGLAQNKGGKQLEVKIRSAARVIESSGADIGKFDCEGAEISLLKLPESILRKIEFYIIETHSLQIRNAIVDKFVRSGFKQARPPREYSRDLSMLFFEKEPR